MAERLQFLRWLWRTYGRYLTAYFLVVLVIAVFPIWRYADFKLLGTFHPDQQSRTLDPQLAVVDLRRTSHPGVAVSLRNEAAEVLNSIFCGKGRPLAKSGECADTTPAVDKPQVVIFDIVFTRDCRNEPGEKRLEHALAKVTAIRGNAPWLPVYAVELPVAGAPIGSAPLPTLSGCVAGMVPKIDPTLYETGLLSGSGHTVIHIAPIVPNVGWYYPTLPGNSDQLEAIPLLAVGKKHSQYPEPSNEPVVFGIGPAGIVGKPPAMVPLGSALHDPSPLVNKVVVVGNLPTERFVNDRSGLELLLWALNDRLRLDISGPQLVTSTPLMLIVTILLSAGGAWLFLYLVRPLQTKRSGVLIAALGAIIGMLILLLVFDVTVVAIFKVIYVRLSLVVAGILAAVAAAVWWNVDAVRHARFLKALWAKTHSHLEYDVFISHTRTAENNAWVEKNIYMPLTASGAKVFFDRDAIKAGMDWYDRIVTAIYGSRCFVPVYSVGYFSRWFCRDELELAMFRRSEIDQFVVPVSRIGPRCPPRYRRIQYIDALEVRDPSKTILSVIAALRSEEASDA